MSRHEVKRKKNQPVLNCVMFNKQVYLRCLFIFEYFKKGTFHVDHFHYDTDSIVIIDSPFFFFSLRDMVPSVSQSYDLVLAVYEHISLFSRNIS